MNVTCPNCATVYRVDPAKVPEGGVRARCNICSAVFAVRRDGEAQEHPASTTAVGAASPPASPAAPPAAQPAPRESVRPPAPSVSAAPAAPPPPPMPPAASPASTTSGAAGSQPTGYPPPAAPAATPRPAAAPAAPAAAAPSPAIPRPAAAAPASAPRPAAPAAVPPTPAPPPRPAVPTGSRPVNPFLSQDPALKARRLARALISDMVVYHPAKRQEGLRDGNLKDLFEDEIRKSWEEYSDQVGKDVADSTPYFKEALNEILAGGRQIF